MSRFLTTAAITLLFGVAAALAETKAPISEPSPPIPADLSGPASPPQVAAPAPSGMPADAPQPLSPPQSAAIQPQPSPFLAKQDTSDLLIGNLIGETVMTPDNESIGEITDLITDKNGKVLAVLIGAGGFLGIGQKDVAIRFEDIKVSRDENNDLAVTANVTKAMIARAPDYQTLDDQQIIMGEKNDRENSSQ